MRKVKVMWGAGDVEAERREGERGRKCCSVNGLFSSETKLLVPNKDLQC